MQELSETKSLELKHLKLENENVKKENNVLSVALKGSKQEIKELDKAYAKEKKLLELKLSEVEAFRNEKLRDERVEKTRLKKEKKKAKQKIKKEQFEKKEEHKGANLTLICPLTLKADPAEVNSNDDALTTLPVKQTKMKMKQLLRMKPLLTMLRRCRKMNS